MSNTVAATQLSVAVTGLRVLVVLGVVAAAGYVWRRHRDEPSARAFLGFLAVLSLLAAVHAVAAALGQYTVSPWRDYMILGNVALGVAWFVFAVRYTDRRGVLEGWRLLLVAVPVAAVGLVSIVENDVLRLLAGLSFVVVLFMVGVGGFLLLRVALTSRRIRPGQPLALLLAGFVPFVVQFFESFVATGLSGFLPGIVVRQADIFLVGLLAGVAGVWLALGHYRMFAFVPSVVSIGRDQVVDEMREGVIVTDRNDRIIDLNPSVAETYGVSTDVIGDPVAAVLGGGVTLDKEENPVEIRTPDGQRWFEMSVSPITEGEGEIGRTLVLRDITRRKTREQRLQVLNRVLRHNLRNDLNVVTGSANIIRSQTENEAIREHSERIERSSRRLINLGAKARDLDDILESNHRRETVEIESLLRATAEDLRRDWPESDVVVDGASCTPVETVPTLLVAALEAAIENGLEHNEADRPTVRLSAAVEGEEIVIAIADNGPGIPQQERQVVESRSETQLEHGSGLGLWLIAWCIQRLGGDVSFEIEDGTTVAFHIPRQSAGAADDWEGEIDHQLIDR